MNNNKRNCNSDSKMMVTRVEMDINRREQMVNGNWIFVVGCGMAYTFKRL